VDPFDQASFDRAQRNQELGLPANVTLAPIWRRMVAQLVDQLVVLVPVVLVAFAMGVRTSDDLTAKAFGLNIAVVSTAFIYEFSMITVWGRTVGKFAWRTRVVRVDNADKVLWSSSAVRALVPLAAGVIPGIGFVLSIVVYASAMFDKRQQGFHDKAAGTIVVMR
jgi:uncharacterized RDD family membrane protein YckC